MGKWFVAVGAALAALFSVSVLAATAVAAPETLYCLNGVSTTLPADIFASSATDGDRTWSFTEDEAGQVLSESGGLFWFGRHAEEGWWGLSAFTNEIFEPGYSTNSVALGACEAAGGGSAYVFVDRNFWLCFSQSRNPSHYGRGLAMKLYEAGYTVPYAAQAPVSDTNIGNGVYLTCDLPTGYSVRAGVAVSTGGGDIFTEPPDLVKYMLTEMPLDYTVLIAD